MDEEQLQSHKDAEFEEEMGDKSAPRGDDSVDDDYFDQEDDDQQLDENHFATLLKNKEHLELVQQYLKGKNGENPENGHAEPEKEEIAMADPTGFAGDSEDETLGKRADLADFMQEALAYTEAGQLETLKGQVSQMTLKKNFIRDKIKQFMDCTFDPVIFSSLSRLIAIRILAYNHHTFDEVHSEGVLLACLSLFSPEEFTLIQELRSSNFSTEDFGSTIKVLLVLIKALVLKYSPRLIQVLRPGISAQRTVSDLTTVEILSLYSLLLNYILKVKTRLICALSFDKINLDHHYRLNMYAGDKNAPEDGGDVKKTMSKLKKLVKDSKKSKPKKGKKQESSEEEYESSSDQPDSNHSSSGEEEFEAGFDDQDDSRSAGSGKNKPAKKKLSRLKKGAKKGGRSKRPKGVRSRSRDSEESNVTSDSAIKMFEYGPLKDIGIKEMREEIHGKDRTKQNGKGKKNGKQPMVEEEGKIQVQLNLNENLSEKLRLIVQKMESIFGQGFYDKEYLRIPLPLMKAFIEVLPPQGTIFEIVDVNNFELATSKDSRKEFIKQIFHKTFTMFIFAIRRANIHPEDLPPREENDRDPQDELEIFNNKKTVLKEVTPIYLKSKWHTLYKQQFMISKYSFVRLPNLIQYITNLNKLNPYNLTEEELQLELEELIRMERVELTVMPTKLPDFAYTRMLCRKNHLKMSHTVRPGATPVTIINDREIYKRRDLMKLYTKVQWRNKGFDIPKGTVPAKSIPNGDKKPVEYFSEDQTVELLIRLDKKGKIPQNEYGNIEVMNGVPPGTEYLDLKGIKQVLKKITPEIDWVPAVREFEFRHGRFYPILSGAVIHIKDKEKVMAEYEKRREEIALREVDKEEKFMFQLWKEVFKFLYTKKYFSEKNNGPN